jgi:hypothetical protein
MAELDQKGLVWERAFCPDRQLPRRSLKHSYIASSDYWPWRRYFTTASVRLRTCSFW